MKTSSVFKNRWMAILWAAGIVWFAYDFAESQPQAPDAGTNAEQATDVTGAPITPEDQNKVQEVLQNL